MSEEQQNEIARLRMRVSIYHRRAQKAEAACLQFKKEWDKHGGPRGGSFGRAVLATGWHAIEEDNERLRAFVKRCGHMRGCPVNAFQDRCTCGYADVIAEGAPAQ